MEERRRLLAEAMVATATTQSQLARWSGVRQPSISQFLSGRTTMSDDMLERLVACMGLRLHVARTTAEVTLDRSTRTRWLLHRRLRHHLTPDALDEWRPRILRNLDRVEQGVVGEPHVGNLRRWRRIVDGSDLVELGRVMTGLDDDAIAMREVSPLAGLLPEGERDEALGRRPA